MAAKIDTSDPRFATVYDPTGKPHGVNYSTATVEILPDAVTIRVNVPTWQAPVDNNFASWVDTNDNPFGGTAVAAQAAMQAALSEPIPAFVIEAEDGAIVTLGAKADTAATTDTGTFSLMAFIKRGMQYWNTAITGLTSIAASLVSIFTRQGDGNQITQCITHVSITQTTGTATNTSAVALAANTNRKYLLIRNTHVSAVLCVRFGAAAATTDFQIAAGSVLVFETNAIPTNSVNLIRQAAVSVPYLIWEG